MDYLPQSPTPESAVAVHLVGACEDPALTSTRIVAICRMVSRLHERAQAGKATSRRDSLFAMRWMQADTLLRPYGLALIVAPDGVGIGTVESKGSPAPVWKWKVDP